MATPPDIARHYARMQIQTSATPRAICMLHERCAQLIQLAQGTGVNKRDLLNRAQNILAQLERSLKITDDISQGLFYLYDYCYCLLDSGDDGDLMKAAEVAAILRETFDILLKPVPDHPRTSAASTAN